MLTGYFAKVKNYPHGKGYEYVSIARYNKFWRGREYKKLAPPPEIIKLEGEEYKKQYYEKVLCRLDPKQVYEELGENAVLLCYESWESIKNGRATCHRRVVAKWLEDNLGIKVYELGEMCEQTNFLQQKS